MAAPPNVANAEAQASLNWAADIAGPPSLRAARSSKRLRVARELQAVNGITEAELGEHEGFHARCALHAGGGPALEEVIDAVPGVPAWFGPAMAVALQPVQAQLNNDIAEALRPLQAQLNNDIAEALRPLQAQLNNIQADINNIQADINNIQADINNIDAEMNNIVARQMNSVASDPMDALRGLTNQAGVAFANFPDTLQALVLMNGGQMNAFLIHYGLVPGGAIEVRLQRIKKFIGMRIA